MARRLPKILIIIGTIACVLGALIGGYYWGQGGGASTAYADTVTIVDSNGEYVDVPYPVERIIAMNSDCAEIIWALEAQDKVVGVTTGVLDDPFFATAYAGVTDVGGWGWGTVPDIERIIVLDPDVVICYGSWPEEADLEEHLIGTGIVVVRLDCYKLETLDRDVAAMGLMLGKQDRAWEYINFYSSYLAVVDYKLTGVENNPKVYIEGYGDYKSMSQDTGGGGMCLRAGGNNIYADSTILYPEVDPEWVVEQQPNIIVKAVGNEVIPSGSGYGITDASPLKAKRDEIMNPDIRPGWDTIPAIKEGKVYLMTTDIYTGPRATIGVLYMAKWFHPVEFSDIDPAKVHQEWLQKFHGIDPELTGSFIFAYPEFD